MTYYYLFPTEEEANAYISKVNTIRGYHQNGDVTVTWAVPCSFSVGSPIPALMWGVPKYNNIEPDSLINVMLEEYTPDWL